MDSTHKHILVNSNQMTFRHDECKKTISRLSTRFGVAPFLKKATDVAVQSYEPANTN